MRTGWRVVGVVCALTLGACAQEVTLESVGLAESGGQGPGPERPDSPNAAVSDSFPAIGDHVHAAYGVFICDEWIPVEEDFANASGIHSHGDGVIHVHPFVDWATGENATLGLFLDDSSRVALDDGWLSVDGEEHVDGDTCGGEPAEVVVAKWSDVNDLDAGPEIHRQGLVDLRFEGNGELYTIALVASGADVPPPPHADRLYDLGVPEEGSY